MSFRAVARNPVWMLHCVQHDKEKRKRFVQHDRAVSLRAVARNPAYGCFTSLRFVQHDTTEDVIASKADNLSTRKALRERNAIRLLGELNVKTHDHHRALIDTLEAIF